MLYFSQGSPGSHQQVSALGKKPERPRSHGKKMKLVLGVAPSKAILPGLVTDEWRLRRPGKHRRRRQECNRDGEEATMHENPSASLTWRDMPVLRRMANPQFHQTKTSGRCWKNNEAPIQTSAKLVDLEAWTLRPKSWRAVAPRCTT